MLKVLVACEESQAVTSAFLEKGHDAYSCDLVPCSGKYPERHLQCDALTLLDPGYHWDLIIAHPPCTYLSKAGSCRLCNKDGKIINYDRFQLLLEGREFFYKFYDIDFCPVAIENPIPMSICHLPKPSFTIDPYEFGHPFSKRTYLWLKGLPPLMPTDIILNHTDFTTNIHGSCLRSKTFPGIAAAMADQWGAYLEN